MSHKLALNVYGVDVDFLYHSIDNILAEMIICKIREKIIGTVMCCVVCTLN